MLVGCFLWLPWCVSQQRDYLRLGNAWLWAGPYTWEESHSCENNLTPRWDAGSNDWICVEHVEPREDIFDQVAGESTKGHGHAMLDDLVDEPKAKAKRTAYKEYMPYAQPDSRLIFLRLLAATTICAALFVAVRLHSPSS